jgi:D-alanine-D-alanine ligase
MNQNKIKVGLLYGGNSSEHDVSIMTADSIVKNIDKSKFDLVKIFIDRNGKMNERLLKKIDIAFLAVHGNNCEDGKLQKYLEDRGVKYTGAGVEASALNMNKIRMHQAFLKAGLKTVKYIGFKNDKTVKEIKKEVAGKIGYPCFVKPNNGGSSIGMTKVENQTQIHKAVAKARKYDNVIIIEKAVASPREFEMAVLGNDKLVISEPGEVLSDGEFYSYKKKYFEPFSTTVKPSGITNDEIAKIKRMAKKAYKATGCTGYARIDFFINMNREILINEINTLPGFTEISMYPKLMVAIGINYKDLITKIIMLGLER